MSPAGNGYFAALIRSSGLRIGSASVVPDGRASAHDLVEISEERVAPGPVARGAPVERDRVESLDAPAEAALDSPEPTPHHAAATEDQPSRHPRGSALSTPVAPASTPSAIETQADVFVDGTAPRPQVDPVRLAMQWVAADPEARAALRRTASSATPPAPAPPPSAIRPAEPIVVEEIEVQRGSVPAEDDVRARPAAGQLAVRAIGAPSPAPSRDARPSDMEGGGIRRSAAPVEEVVEISIGAINLHVEAPPRQTVIQSPAASRPQPTPTPRRERSDLARRYLRSF